MPRKALLLGKGLDQTIQEYIRNLRVVGGVINIPILLVLPGGIICAKIVETKGHNKITND